MELIGVSYQINDKLILNNLNIKFEKNSINLIIGPNGSGKSTILKLLYKINKLTIGEIKLKNKNIKNYKKIHEEIGYLGQYNSIFHKVDLLYFLKLNRYIKTNTLVLDDFTNWIIDLFSLRKLLKQPLASLSGGERQKAVLASIFLLEREYILLDEPFSYLDISTKLDLVKIIEENFKDKTFIIITHNLKIFKSIKKIIALKNGKLFFDENQMINDKLEELFDIKGSNYFSTL